MTLTRALLLAPLVLFIAAVSVDAKPSVRILPANNARFVRDQRFDIRVEVTPTAGQTLTSVTIAVDGATRLSSVDGLDTNGSFTIRGFASNVTGPHTISVVASESGDTSPATASSAFEIVDASGGKRRYRNVIICLGDGMGSGQRTAARIVRYGYTNGRANGRLAMDDFPVTGLVMTSSLNSIVTDSSPGMSAYSTGNKANNGQEGVYPDNTPSPFDNPRVEYIGEYAWRKLGKSVGIVTTADVEDATPAAMAAHTANRGAGTGICDQFLDENELPGGRGNGIAVLLGGGRRWFLPSTDGSSNRTAVTDYALDASTASALGVPAGAVDPERNLLADFRTKGFGYAATRTELDTLSRDSRTRKLVGLFAPGSMNLSYDKIAKRRNPSAPGPVDAAPDQPMLDEMAHAAITVLDRNRKGFVLLVEGAEIDVQSHRMDADRAIWETIEFDNAVRVCREFAERDGNTLVIVVADHETSGFSVLGALKRTTADMLTLPGDASNTSPSSGTAPARQQAVGTYADAGFPKYTIAADGYPLTSDPDYKLVVGFGASADRYETWLAEPGEAGERDSGYFIRGQVPGESASHTANDIPMVAFGGRAAQQFTGVQDNTDVFVKLMRALLGGY